MWHVFPTYQILNAVTEPAQYCHNIMTPDPAATDKQPRVEARVGKCRKVVLSASIALEWNRQSRMRKPEGDSKEDRRSEKR